MLNPIEEIAEENQTGNTNTVNLSQEKEFSNRCGDNDRLSSLSSRDQDLQSVGRKKSKQINRESVFYSDSPHSHRVERRSRFAPTLENSDPSNDDKTEDSNRDRKSEAMLIQSQADLTESGRSNPSQQSSALIFDEIALEILEGWLIRP